MKNTIKMSLVAALAVAGLSSTASAGSLEEAIKGVSISGKMEVEYEKKMYKSGGDDTDRGDRWDYDFDITAKVPVNDNVTAIAGFQADKETDIEEETGNGNVDMPKIYFQYANGPVTAMVGKQSIGAPWFDDARGNGVKALFNTGPVTLAAAHFTGTTSDGLTSELEKADISAIAAIGSIGPVNFQAWYANLSGITATLGTTLDADADSLVLMADAKFDIVNVGIRHAQADYDLTDNSTHGDPEAELTKIDVSVDFGVAKPYAGYAWTNDDDDLAGDTADRGEGVDLDDNDSGNNFGKNIVFLDDYNDADAWMLGVTVPFGSWKIDAYYLDGDSDNDGVNTDFDEMGLDVEYKMSKNFTIDAYWAKAEIKEDGQDEEEKTDIEIALEYKF
jgi:hypothetical protein